MAFSPAEAVFRTTKVALKTSASGISKFLVAPLPIEMENAPTLFAVETLVTVVPYPAKVVGALMLWTSSVALSKVSFRKPEAMPLTCGTVAVTVTTSPALSPVVFGEISSVAPPAAKTGKMPKFITMARIRTMERRRFFIECYLHYLYSSNFEFSDARYL